MMPDLKILLAERGLRLTDLARMCGVSNAAATNWCKREPGIPLIRVFEVEKATGIPREKLRPDLFAEAAQ